MDVIFDVVRERSLNDEGQAGDIDAARRDVRADEEPNVSFPEGFQIRSSLVLVAHPGKDHARIRVFLARFHLAAVAFAAPQPVQVVLEVVAIDVCSAEHQALCHIESIGHLHRDLWFHSLDGLGHSQCVRVLGVQRRHRWLVVHPIKCGLLAGSFRAHRKLLVGPRQYHVRVDVVSHVVHGFGHAVLALEVDPNRPRRDLVDHLHHKRVVQGGTEEKRLHPVPATPLDLGIQPRDLMPFVLFLQIVGFVED
mmetsp:Transcript_95319/g.269450  ORF Transcript_95319/g.269450 Transcript_95319/m.269450 type:complete len:251 (+) Transcript_95319:881-1633(+)